MTARDLVAHATDVFDALGLDDRAFVRPDSPLKPFSGREVERARLTLAALDHGFYYDDDALPVVVAPVRDVRREWRYVVCAGEVVSGSAYLADGRAALPVASHGAPWAFAQTVARALTPPDPIFVLDICEVDGGLHLLELNPFSGADLYSCEPGPIVDAISALASVRREGCQ